MSDGFEYADIIILALIAGFVLLRLRAVLGQKIGHDAPPQFGGMREAEADSPVVKLGEKPSLLPTPEEKDEDEQLVKAIPDGESAKVINQIKTLDQSFGLKPFLEGARSAFEMVFDSFAKDDRDTLKMLLSKPLYDVFSAELDARKAGERHTETTLLAVISQELKAAKLEKNTARLTVRFVSEQVSVVRDREGKIVEGDPGLPEHVEDEWTFERDVSSRNPNWKIIDT